MDKKKWERPALVVIGTNDMIEKNTFSNKEANYHHVTGTQYDNAAGTIHINKMTFDSAHS
ncbi:hypothetical protein ACFGVR_05265 [Mucilaginibacter sp. AW1-3]